MTNFDARMPRFALSQTVRVFRPDSRRTFIRKLRTIRPRISTDIRDNFTLGLFGFWWTRHRVIFFARARAELQHQTRVAGPRTELRNRRLALSVVALNRDV
jgi:hypothetical protein